MKMKLLPGLKGCLWTCRPSVWGGLAAALAVLVLGSGTPAYAGLIITPDFSDPAWQAQNTASGGALNAAVNNAITTYEGLFANNITVRINFQWGGSVGGSGSGAAALPAVNSLTLAQTEALFVAHAAAHSENIPINAAVPHLPATFPNPDPSGSSSFLITTAEKAALTGISSGLASDGTIGFGSSSTSGFWAAFALHEIGHIMGRFDQAFAAPPNPPILTPLDFFKYDPNTTTLDPRFVVTNFSYDGGATNPGGRQWSNISDSGDWLNPPSDPYNWQTNGGAILSSPDIALDNALGWDPPAQATAVPEPTSMTLLGAGTLLLSAFGWRRRKQRARETAA
jgi:hypothetical protein